ncbi:TIGR04219 family outer membrane beta-barrel protein [Desulfobotulus mexicanus]|uniref:TIGR04219 family outer membrane beta-barrel protein n=1 Tax=Desulfobotulus mexicanus TaxID=2586642 RepID=A0A5S5MFC8_9BACT|nr:TIGR04219 family outer membrane beta-barrel protein [Desulfobotulus mexicanus]TYT74404.1 TIGR04219 family outer membrane beta-barrel protein [Desulfobotulus mexicanus]
MKRIHLIAVLAFFLALPSYSSALPLINAEVAVGGWMQMPSGDMGVSRGGVNGTRLDMDRDLGYDSEWGMTGRFRINLPLILPNVYVMGTAMDFSGTGSFQNNFDFAGQNFFANMPYNSSLTADQLDVTLFYGVPFLGIFTLGTTAIDFGLNVRIYQLDASMTQGLNSFSESTNVALPMAYLSARFEPIDSLGLEAEFRGLVIGDSQVLSGIGRIRYNFMNLPFLVSSFVAGGWRHEIIDLDESGIRVDTTFSGPFVEAGLRF